MGVPIHQEILRLDVSVTNPDGSNHIPMVRNHGVQLLDKMLNITVDPQSTAKFGCKGMTRLHGCMHKHGPSAACAEHEVAKSGIEKQSMAHRYPGVHGP